MTEKGFTSRLQKGGALLDDMRSLVVAWPEREGAENLTAFVMSRLGKPSSARAKDTIAYAFRPRFLQGSPKEAWRLANALEAVTPDNATVRAFYYWITARSEYALYHYVTAEMTGWRNAERVVTTEEVAHWLRERLREQGREWSDSVATKVALGMLAALRDFGILEGRSKKRLAARHCPLRAFVLIAHVLYSMGYSGRNLVEHSDWKLFRYDVPDVEQALLEAHQHGWLNYQVAGQVRRIEFPTDNFKEYAGVVFG